MNKIKKGLGRGLSSLIGETKAETKTNKLSLSEIVPNKLQPRKFFDEESLNDLTNSIRERKYRAENGSPSIAATKLIKWTKCVVWCDYWTYRLKLLESFILFQ